MSKKCTYGFDRKLFCQLIKQTDATYEDLSNKIDISEASIVQYMSGKVIPTITALIKISDYFQVPIDVLMGRYTQEEYTEILKGNAEYMYKCRKAALEDYLIRKKSRGTIMEDTLEHKDIYYTPYPYNLVKCVLGEPVDEIIDDDQMAGLEQALDYLSPRERKAVQLYYEEERTLKEIGKEFGVTQERIRQIVSKAIRKLRNPTKVKLIRHGPRAQELERLEKIEANIIAKKQAITEHLAELEVLEAQANAKTEEVMKKPGAKVIVDEVAELDLSIRSYNCLRRANCYTIQDVIKLFENGLIWKVRNLGRKSIQEIIDKIGSTYGIEFKLICDGSGPAYYECTYAYRFDEVG